LLLALAGIFASPARAAEPPWCETRSDTFQLVSDLPETEQRELLQKLLRLEQIAEPFMPGEPVSRSDPLKLVVFQHRKDFLALTGKRKFAGYMQPSLQTNRLLIGPIRGGLDETTLHEYAHYLLRSRGGVSLPLWFDEGLATLLGNTRLSQDTAVIGSMPAERLERRLDRNAEFLSPQQRLNRTLEASDLQTWRSERINEFYDLAWLLVHYLYFDVYQEELVVGAITTAGLTGYLQAGEPTLQEHLNVSSSQLLRALERHLDRWDPPEPVPIPEVRVANTEFRCLTALERDLSLALAVHMQNPDKARSLLKPHSTRSALAAMNDAQAIALKIALARIEVASDAIDAAESRVQEALSLAPEHPEAIILGADLLVHDCLFERSEDCSSRWQRAGASYRSALRRDPSRYDGILGVGLAELHGGRPGDAANYLKVAHSRAPWAAVINFYLGESYRLMGDSRARVYLENARSWAEQEVWRLLAEESRRLLAEDSQSES
jgi:tetratricopeptide (TPR) repeat protein